jgi:hypothetical protein
LPFAIELLLLGMPGLPVYTWNRVAAELLRRMRGPGAG